METGSPRSAIAIRTMPAPVPDATSGRHVSPGQESPRGWIVTPPVTQLPSGGVTTNAAVSIRASRSARWYSGTV